jgi:HPt (histidine-containing phosphotransfer) domain-containing protein
MTGIAHSLAGAGGTLGFPEISNMAFEVESILLEENFDGRAAAALDQLIQTLEAVTASSK